MHDGMSPDTAIADDYTAHKTSERVNSRINRRTWVVEELLPFLRARGGVASLCEIAEVLDVSQQFVGNACEDATRYVVKRAGHHVRQSIYRCRASASVRLEQENDMQEISEITYFPSDIVKMILEKHPGYRECNNEDLPAVRIRKVLRSDDKSLKNVPAFSEAEEEKSAFEKLLSAVGVIDPDAARWLAANTDSERVEEGDVPSQVLQYLFTWCEAPHGASFWSDIQDSLVAQEATE